MNPPSNISEVVKEFEETAIGSQPLVLANLKELLTSLISQAIQRVEELKATKTKKINLEWAQITDPDQILGYNAALDQAIQILKEISK